MAPLGLARHVRERVPVFLSRGAAMSHRIDDGDGCDVGSCGEKPHRRGLGKPLLLQNKKLESCVLCLCLIDTDVVL